MSVPLHLSHFLCVHSLKTQLQYGSFHDALRFIMVKKQGPIFPHPWTERCPEESHETWRAFLLFHRCNESGYSVIVFECMESVVKTMYNLIAPHERREMNISNFFTQSCRRVCLNRNSRDSNMLVHKGYGRRYHKAQEYCSIYIYHELKVWFPNYLLLRLSKV